MNRGICFALNIYYLACFILHESESLDKSIPLFGFRYMPDRKALRGRVSAFYKLAPCQRCKKIRLGKLPKIYPELPIFVVYMKHVTSITTVGKT